jgi:hypothetical protein
MKNNTITLLPQQITYGQIIQIQTATIPTNTHITPIHISTMTITKIHYHHTINGG